MRTAHWRFHHIGLATKSVEQFLSRFRDLDPTEDLQFRDSIQGVAGKFVKVGGVSFEIMEPLDGDQTLDPWLTNGNRVYQVAFEVDDLEAEIHIARSDHVRIVREPHPSVAFNGRRVAFLMPAPGLIVELIEAT